MGCRCRVCKRVLKNPLSVELGIGPVCRAKDSLQGEFDFMKAQAIEGFGDVHFSRNKDGGVVTNVPQRIFKHICYPNGGDMQWGYGGSGCSDFALNILSCYIGEVEAENYYMAFKWDFISGIQEDNGVIKREDIMRWLAEKGYVAKT